MARHYFTDEEVKGLSPELITMLSQARIMANVPFVITSGLRKLDENTIVGGVKDSSHLKGLAVDISCSRSRERFLMLNALLTVGFTRVGIYDRHIHADIDGGLPQDVIWTGKSS